MTRGWHTNEAFLYQRLAHEADNERAKPLAPRIAPNPPRQHIFRGVILLRDLGNDGRPCTVHAEAERSERASLSEVVAGVIERNEARRRVRRTVWQTRVRTAEAWRAGHERMPAAAATRAGGVDVDAPGWNCELYWATAQ